jgi:predicted TIM-barrel fold metal-dependent hydrolase
LTLSRHSTKGAKEEPVHVDTAQFPRQQGAQPGAALPLRQRRRIIVDSQIHMWKANTPDRPWAPGTRPQLPEPMTIERVVPMIDEGGVERVVIVPPTLEGERVDYGQEAAKRYPGRFATMGRIALDDPGSARRLST